MSTALSTLYNNYKNFKIENLVDEKNNYDTFAKAHPNIDKIILTACHIFRLLMMIPLSNAMPLSTTANAALMLTGSLIYRIVPERKCDFRFAILSSLGAIAFIFAKNSGFTFVSCIPLTAYAIAVIDDVWKKKECANCKQSTYLVTY